MVSILTSDVHSSRSLCQSYLARLTAPQIAKYLRSLHIELDFLPSKPSFLYEVNKIVMNTEVQQAAKAIVARIGSQFQVIAAQKVGKRKKPTMSAYLENPR